MKKKILAGLAALGLAQLAGAALPAGVAAPDFSAPAALAGQQFDFSLRAALKKGPVIVYFYPSAYTNGCNVQAHAFAERHAEFAAAGASVIGVSQDSIARLNAFSADPDYCAGKVAVASDQDGRIARAYALQIRDLPAGRQDTRGNAIDHALSERTTFIVTPDGRIARTLDGLAPLANVEQALAFVQQLAGQPHH